MMSNFCSLAKPFLVLLASIFLCGTLPAQDPNPFTAPIYFLEAGNNYCTRVEVADVDGDGLDDAVTMAYSGNIAWIKTDAQGTPPALHLINPELHQYYSLKLADWDNDQDVDVLYFSQDQGFIYWQANDGAGNFGPQQALLPGISGFFLGDLNHDGLPDIINILDIDPDPNVNQLVFQWYPNDGMGHVSAPQLIDMGNAAAASEPAVADIDADGDSDLVWVNDSLKLFSLLNDGVGNFAPVEVLASDSNLYQTRLQILDFDGDGDLDIFPEGLNYGGLAYFPNDGTGHFGPAIWVSPDSASYRYPFSVADFSGDGLPDILSADGVYNIVLLTNQGIGQKFAKLVFQSYDLNQDLTAGDMDGDGDMDVLRIGGGLTWMQNLGAGNFAPPDNFYPVAVPIVIASADLDGNGLNDYLIGDDISHRSDWFPNLGNGQFGPKKNIGTGLFGTEQIIPADMDNDGDLDILTNELIDNRTQWFANDGAGNFGSGQTLWTSPTFGFFYPSNIFARDFDNDGDTDVLTPEKLLFNDGVGHFDSVLNDLYLQGGYFPYDIDNDKFVDIFQLGYWLKFNGKDSFVFQNNQIQPLGFFGSLSSELIDMDGDSIPELFMAVQNNDWNLLLRQNNAFFGPALPSDTLGISPVIGGVPSRQLQSADMDGDGRRDLIISNYWALGNWLIGFNGGQGKFEGWAQVNFDGPVLPADFNGDGIPDLQCYQSEGNKLGWMRSFVRQFWAAGSCFLDENGDGLRQPGEPPLQNMGVGLAGGAAISFTDTLGRFRLFANPSETHEIQFFPNLCWALSSDSTLLTLAPSESGYSNLEFGFKKLADTTAVRPIFVGAQTRCGTNVPFWATLQNVGCLPASGRLGIVSDTATLFQNASPMPDLVSPGPDGRDTIWWAFDSLPPSLSRMFRVEFLMPDANHVGDSIHLSSFLFLKNAGQMLVLTDSNFIASQIRCAFDPNDKMVNLPTLPPYYLPAANELVYTVRFQNTGNDTAATVRIRDTLDYWLDLSTIQLLGASHRYRCELNLAWHGVEFVFENIALPDSTTNEAASHGFVSFAVKPFAGLSWGESILNRVDIYFDQNPPVSTNQIETVVVFPVSTKNPVQPPRAIIFPNPNSGTFSVELPYVAKEDMSFRIIGLTGQIQQEQRIHEGSKMQTVQAGDLPAGLYFLQMVSEGKVLAIEKFVKQ